MLCDAIASAIPFIGASIQSELCRNNNTTANPMFVPIDMDIRNGFENGFNFNGFHIRKPFCKQISQNGIYYILRDTHIVP